MATASSPFGFKPSPRNGEFSKSSSCAAAAAAASASASASAAAVPGLAAAESQTLSSSSSSSSSSRSSNPTEPSSTEEDEAIMQEEDEEGNRNTIGRHSQVVGTFHHFPSASNYSLQVQSSILTIEVELLLQEAKALFSESTILNRLRAPPDAQEDPYKNVASALLSRSLGQLVVCVRSWLDFERAWLFRIIGELCRESRWAAQFARQTRWTQNTEATATIRHLTECISSGILEPRHSLQVVCSLARWDEKSVYDVHVRSARFSHVVKSAAKIAITKFSYKEIVLTLELLLDAAHSFGRLGITDARREICELLIQAALRDGAEALSFRNELYWALVVRSCPSKHPEESPELRSWAAQAVESLISRLPSPAEELDLFRQRSWIEGLQNHNFQAGSHTWWDMRAFSLVVWPGNSTCQGTIGEPKFMSSKNKPFSVCCKRVFQSASNSAEPRADAATSSTGGATRLQPPKGPREEQVRVMFKNDSDIRFEHQVGKFVQLLEMLILEDSQVQELLKENNLTPDDVRVTYNIVMTGRTTAVVEFIEDAKTLREVRALAPHKAEKPATPGEGLGIYLRKGDRQTLVRVSYTSAISAMLCLVAGLGDRHHENYMVTKAGRFLHIDYGYALGQEPVDSKLLQWISNKKQPPALVQFEELMEVVDPKITQMVFWPMIKNAFRVFRNNESLLSEMLFAAVTRYPGHREREAWALTQDFVARKAALALSEVQANQFIETLFHHCIRQEDAARQRDNFKKGADQIRETAAQVAGLAMEKANIVGRGVDRLLVAAGSLFSR
mmetsp:Transcript_61718/g.130249  ORF Transcript_61718/g.130249 Transcript_61718/m.130249 type:complete len:788 (-) Transcript_61718:370-2733(-)